MRIGLLICACALAAVAGCGVTETGNPPARPILDESEVGIVLDPILVPGVIHVRGEPGSVEPPEGEIAFVLLDGTTPFERLPVMADGSFDGSVTGGDGVLRMQVVGSEARSEARDFLVDLATETLTALGPPLPCANVETSMGVSAGGTISVTIDNECPEPLPLEPPRLRRGTAWVLEGGYPGSIPPTSSGSIPVRNTVDGGDDVLFIDLASPVDARLAVTVYVDPG